MNKILIVAAVLVATTASAQTTSTPRVDQRQAAQDARIQQGVQSGQLTEREAAKLERGQQHVQNMENKATADGTVTRKESSRIEHAQDQQNRKIKREKHDRQHDRNHDGRQDRPHRQK